MSKKHISRRTKRRIRRWFDASAPMPGFTYKWALWRMKRPRKQRCKNRKARVAHRNRPIRTLALTWIPRGKWSAREVIL